MGIQKYFYFFLFLLFWGGIFCVPKISLASDIPFLITEIDSVSEFIEFQNISTKEQETEGWKWSEMTSSGIEKEYDMDSVSLLPKEVFVITMSRKINDTGDTVSLISPEGKKISVVVPKKKEGFTYQYIDGAWDWRDETRGIVSNAPEEEETEEEETEEEETGEEETGEEETGEEEAEEVLKKGNILLTELLPNPDGTDGGENEFLELWNTELFPVDIGGWTVQDKGGKSFVFPEFTILKPQEYRSFFRSETGITLNNSDESIFLFDRDRTLVSELFFYGSAKEGYSLVRIDSFGVAEWNIQNTPNMPTQKQLYSEEVIFSEMLPNPEGTDGDQNEFLELWNKGSHSINISGWMIVDEGGKSFLFPENTILQPNEYRAFFKYETGITLNNSNESLYLYNPNGEIVSRIAFVGSASSGWSFSYSGTRYVWTDTSTSNSSNRITGDYIISSSSSDSDVFFPVLNLPEQDIELLIMAVSPHSKNDFVDILCKKCDTDLGGVRLYIDSVVYQVPEKTVVKTGEMLRFVFGNTEGTVPYKVEHTWVFPGIYKNITRTDETVVIGDSKGNILDALCYSDQNKNFISTEKKEIGKLILNGSWKGDLKEWGCVSTQALPRNTVLYRTGTSDTNSSVDFTRQRGSVLKTLNTDSSSVFITKIQLQNEKTSFVIKNTGSNPVNISDWYFANHSSWLIDLHKSNDTDGILFPGQVIQVEWNPYKAKKYARENMMLSLRSGNGVIQDVVCFNRSKDKKEKQKSGKILSQWYQKRWWKKQKKQPECFEYFHTKYIDTYIRSDFNFPSSVDSYSYTSLLLEEEDDEDLFEEKNESIVLREEKQVLFSDPIFSRSLDEGLFISFSVPKGVSKVRILIPSKGIEWEEKVKGGRIESLFTKPLKRGRYRIQRTLVFRDGREEVLPLDRITLSSPTMMNEIESIKIARVLPNPQGKDSGNEFLVLSNPGLKSGWVRGWKIVVRRGEKESVKPLPRMFLQKGESQVLQKPFLPTLSNSDTVLSLQNPWGEVVDEVSWETARSGEYFGNEAPVFSLSQRSKKYLSSSISMQSSKNVERLSPPLLPKNYIALGTVLAHRDGNFIITVHDLPFFVSFPIPLYLPNVSTVFAPGKHVEVVFYKGVVKDVRLAEMSDLLIPSLGKDVYRPSSRMVVWGGVMMILFMIGGILFFILPSVRKLFKSFQNNKNTDNSSSNIPPVE